MNKQKSLNIEHTKDILHANSVTPKGTIKRLTNKFGDTSSIITDAELKDKALVTQLREMNNYPKCIIMIDADLKIVFYNSNLCNILHYDHLELQEIIITNIIYSQSSKTPMMINIYKIFTYMIEYNMVSADIGVVNWPFLDKRNHVINFDCKFNLIEYKSKKSSSGIVQNLII